LIYFHRLISVLSPDLVLLFDGYNDILADFINSASGWPLHSDLLQSRFEDSFYPRSFRKNFLALLRQSRLLDLVFRRIAERIKPRGPIKPIIDPYNTAENYLHNVLALTRLAAPVPVWVALQPVPASTQKPLSPEEIKIVAEKEQAIQGYTHRVKLTYQGMREGLRSRGISLIDLESAFGTEPELMFADECHFGDLAADRIAQHIAEQWLLQKAFSKSPIADCGQ
jgi:lysophospholipase L1-like esterase